MESQPSAGPGSARCYQATANSGTICMLALPPTDGTSCKPAAPSFSDRDADDTFYCPISTKTCTKKAAVGQPCIETGGCLPGGSCQPVKPAPGSTCAPQAMVGASCTYEDGCLAGGGCNPSTMICDAKVAEGGACKTGNDCAAGFDCAGRCLPHGLIASASVCAK